MQTINDYLLVKVESELVETNESGLYMPDGFVPNGVPKTKQTKGVVVALPKRMYECSHIAPELEVGDKVYFHYNSIGQDSRVLVEYSAPLTYSISYSMIFCAVRNGNIIPIGGRVLCEKYYDPDVVWENVNGAVIPVKMNKIGIITEINVKHSPFKAILRHIGTPPLGQAKPDVKEGDIVYYEKDADFENVIEGKEYLVMMQENLIMKEI
jgi:co-chaperonin GroES (HSP10)